MNKTKDKRVIIIVMDSLGIGALPDASDFGDENSNTLKSIIKSYPDIQMPNLRSMGMGNIQGLNHLNISVSEPCGSFGRMAELSKGKDTITGHWEISGIETKKPFKTYDKFPEKFIDKFQQAIGTKILGNYAASGTVIIDELGPLHEKTRNPIVYTSADSVFQIAANTDIIPLNRLYEICEIARKMLVGDMAIGRVIARPYIIKDGKRIRTSDRKDYSVSPPKDTLLDNIKKSGFEVIAIGKISDIFAGKGITDSIHTISNQDGVDKTIQYIKGENQGLIFTNLVDFDSIYGHRRDPEGYGHAIEEFDMRIPEIKKSMNDSDILILCADHGNDPSYKGWDHTREYVPLIVWGKQIRNNYDLKTRNSFADIASTIADYFEINDTGVGSSFLKQVII